MNFGFGQPVTVLTRTATGRDAHGNTTYTTTSNTVRGAFVPAGSTELVQGQDLVITQPTVYLPPGTPVGAGDAVTVNAVTYEVDGSPNDYTNPITGWRPGVEVKLKAVSG